jgi:hypothetical protein
MKRLDRRSCSAQRRDHSRVDAIDGCGKVGWAKFQWIRSGPVKAGSELVDGIVTAITDISDDAPDDVKRGIIVVHGTGQHRGIVIVDVTKVMASEHRQNLSVEPLHGTANSTLGISQRPFNVVKITSDILALDLSPPIGDLDDPSLQIRKHRCYGR